MEHTFINCTRFLEIAFFILWFLLCIRVMHLLLVLWLYKLVSWIAVHSTFASAMPHKTFLISSDSERDSPRCFQNFWIPRDQNSLVFTCCRTAMWSSYNEKQPRSLEYRDLNLFSATISLIWKIHFKDITSFLIIRSVWNS